VSDTYDGPDPRKGRVLLAVYCQRCSDEHRKDRGQLGRVQLADSSPSWLWVVLDRDLGLARRRGHQVPDFATFGIVAGQVLRAPAHAGLDLQLPESLDAYCRHHGQGKVSTADVLEAVRGAVSGGSRHVVLAFS
jgi:hypothetical protein